MPEKIPVTVRGVYYPSQGAAAAALGVTTAAISLATKRGKLSRVGLGSKPEPVPLRIRGVDYPSLNAAHRALNIPRSTLWRALEEGRLETVGLTKNLSKV